MRQPPDALAVPLSHDDRAHEHLDGSDALERDLALARRLIHAQLVAKLILRDSVGVVNFVAENDEWHLGKFLHGEERVELGLGLGKALVILGVNEEDDAVNFGEIILPEATSYGGNPQYQPSLPSMLQGPNRVEGKRQGRETHPARGHPNQKL